MIDAVAFVVVALAAYRLTRIVTLDTISDPFRARLHRWAWNDDDPVEGVDDEGRPAFFARPRAAWRTWVDGLVTCPLCLGVWVSAATYAAWRWWDVAPVRAVIAIFAVAGLQCFLASKE